MAEHRGGAIPNGIDGAREAAAASAGKAEPLGGEHLTDAIPAQPRGLPRRRPPQRPARDDLAPNGQLSDRLVRLDQQGAGVGGDSDAREAGRATRRRDYIAASPDRAARRLVEGGSVDRRESQRPGGPAGDRGREAHEGQPWEGAGTAPRAG